MGKSAILKSTIHNDHIKVIGRSMSEMHRASIHQLYDSHWYTQWKTYKVFLMNLWTRKESTLIRHWTQEVKSVRNKKGIKRKKNYNELENENSINLQKSKCWFIKKKQNQTNFI